MTSIDVAINYQENNSKGKMSEEELLKFLPIFAKAKKISADWKQILIADTALEIDEETKTRKKSCNKTELEVDEEKKTRKKSVTKSQFGIDEKRNRKKSVYEKSVSEIQAEQLDFKKEKTENDGKPAASRKNSRVRKRSEIAKFV